MTRTSSAAVPGRSWCCSLRCCRGGGESPWGGRAARLSGRAREARRSSRSFSLETCVCVCVLRGPTTSGWRRPFARQSRRLEALVNPPPFPPNQRSLATLLTFAHANGVVEVPVSSWWVGDWSLGSCAVLLLGRLGRWVGPSGYCWVAIRNRKKKSCKCWLLQGGGGIGSVQSQDFASFLVLCFLSTPARNIVPPGVMPRRQVVSPLGLCGRQEEQVVYLYCTSGT